MAKQEGPIVELHRISKRFGNTQALDDAEILIKSGEIHAIVGENGAGKSTLGKVIAGLYAPDSGELLVDGNAVGPHWTVRKAQQSGIVMIAQELSLVPELTVAENVFLGIEHTSAGLLTNDLTQRFAELEDRVHFGLVAHTKLGELAIAERQKVEIMRALAREAKLLILDEPTSSLTGHETEQLHEIMRTLANTGTAIVYVSHFLDAVLEVSDMVTVMRNGRHVMSVPTHDLTKDQMITAMLGKPLDAQFPKRMNVPVYDDPHEEPVLEAINVSGPGVRQMNLTIRRGEIVGLVGLVGSGRTEMAHLVFGVNRISDGAICIDGRERSPYGIRRAIRLGISMVPEDRRNEGLVMQRTIRENVTLLALDTLRVGGLLSGKRERRAAQEVVDKVGVKPPDIQLDVDGLSGGNQQKVLIAKWVIKEPKVIILDEPTRGVDVGSKFAIYEFINSLADSGAAVLLISSEHEEVLNLSDRAYLVSNGETIAEIDPKRTSSQDVLQQLFAAQSMQAQSESVR